MRSVGYVRVSTEEQATQGHSLEAQQAAIEQYAALRGFEIVTIIKDAGVSGGVPLSRRPGGSQMTNHDVSAIIAFKLDRLFRDALDCLDHTRRWDDAGTALHLLDLGGQAIDTSTAIGRFFLTVMAGAAEFERNQIRERTRLAMARKRHEGHRVASVPWGYQAFGHLLVEHPGEQAIVQQVMQLYAEGCSFRKIAEKLNEVGLTNRAGRPFKHPTIGSIVRAARERT